MSVHGLPDRFKPIKCYTGEPETLSYPCLASPKVDGFRCIVAPDGVALSASLKPIPNEFLQAYFQKHKDVLAGLDGEIAVGLPNAHDVFEQTSGALRRKSGEPDFTFWVFDRYDTPDHAYIGRYGAIPKRLPKRASILPNVLFTSADELTRFSVVMLQGGYEGVIARHTASTYKFGRVTLKSGQMIKIKPFVDDEGIILELIEGQKNLNEATISETMNTKRSTCKAGMVPADTLGGIRVKVVTGVFAGIETVLGTGTLTAAQRKEIWEAKKANPSAYLGDVVTFKHMEGSGTYEKPRHGTFLRFRPDFDYGSIEQQTTRS